MEKVHKVGIFFGVLFTVLGVVLLARIDVNYFWIILLLLFGFLFEFGVLGKGSGRFIPAGIFIVIGIVLLLCTVFGYDKMNYLWPMFVFAPGFGLLQAYLASKKKSLMRAASILLTISAIFFVGAFFKIGWARVLFGFILVGLGISILVKSFGRKSE
ncbi:hypothetical protein [Pseudothermotoga sp.]|uniref:hypothetical protein n=1 Tax=Pseudothermotoga sp. TaxID=2033661 RepID=UPI0031F71561